jgi:hypothetical protein
MQAHNGRIDHLHGRVMSDAKCLHDLVPDASPSPANEGIVAGSVWTKAFRQIRAMVRLIARLKRCR